MYSISPAPHIATKVDCQLRIATCTYWSDRSAASESKIRCRTARTRQELEAAFQLLQRRYRQAGLVSSDRNSPDLRIMPYHLQRETQVFVASLENEIVGTVTLILGGATPLPMACSYPNAIARCQRFHRVGEIASLAVAPKLAKPRVVFLQLTRLLSAFARHQGIEYLTATVHPRHAKFYQHAMGFKIIGEEKRCETVGGRPGIPVLGSVNDPSGARASMKAFYFNGDFTVEELSHHPMRKIDRIHFRRWCGPRSNQPRQSNTNQPNRRLAA